MKGREERGDRERGRMEGGKEKEEEGNKDPEILHVQGM